jgi:hypothetical protein
LVRSVLGIAWLGERELRLETAPSYSLFLQQKSTAFLQVAPHPVNAGEIAMTQAKAKLDAVLDAMAEHDRALTAAADDRRLQRQITNAFWERQYARQHELAKQFGQINKWKLTTTHFGLDEFGRRQPRRHQTYNSFDHPLYYRDCYGCFAAIVGQPYGQLDEFRRGRLDALTSDNLTWHCPPEPYASIWFPGSTLFVVVTRTGRPSEVCWLPEQVAPGEVLAKVLEKQRRPARPLGLVTKSLEGWL